MHIYLVRAGLGSLAVLSCVDGPEPPDRISRAFLWPLFPASPQTDVPCKAGVVDLGRVFRIHRMLVYLLSSFGSGIAVDGMLSALPRRAV